MSRPSSAQRTTEVLRVAFGVRPFTPAMAYANGVTRGQLRQALNEGLLERPLEGIMAMSIDHDPASRQRLVIEALLMRNPGSVAVFDSAVVVQRLPSPAPLHGRVHVSRPGATFRRRGHLATHHSPMPSHHVTAVDGIATSTLCRTAVDIARRYRLPRALIVMDAVLRRLIENEPNVSQSHLRDAVHDEGLRSRAADQVSRIAKDLAGWPGIVRAREAIGRGDPASESPLESYSRGVWHECGLPTPACGVAVIGANGLTYWADQMWEEYAVIGECDGMLKYDAPEALREEKMRQEALEQAGWIVVRWTWDEMIRHPQVVAQRLRMAFARGQFLRTA